MRPGSPGLTTPQLILILGGLGLAVLLVGLLIAIPTLNSMRMRSSEAAALSALKTIRLAEITYRDQYPERGYSCSLQALGGDPAAGAAGPESAQLLTGELGQGLKNGYSFNIQNCLHFDHVISAYEITATPVAVGKTGKRGFCINQDGEIKADPKGGTECTESVQ